VIDCSTFRSTPPSASVTSLKPPKSIAITWSMCTSVMHSTVRTARGRPPNANEALILARLPESQAASFAEGTCTHRSRGIDTSCADLWSAGMCMMISVSARHSLPASSLASGSRESLPTIRMFSAPSTVLTGRPFVIWENASVRLRSLSRPEA
jgi:hypothetical protein